MKHVCPYQRSVLHGSCSRVTVDRGFLIPFLTAAIRMWAPAPRHDHYLAESLFLEALPSILRASCHSFSSYCHTLNTHLILPSLARQSFMHFSSPSPSEEIAPVLGDTQRPLLCPCCVLFFPCRLLCNPLLACFWGF